MSHIIGYLLYTVDADCVADSVVEILHNIVGVVSVRHWHIHNVNCRSCECCPIHLHPSWPAPVHHQNLQQQLQSEPGGGGGGVDMYLHLGKQFATAAAIC
jgi:hypothetical protein